MAAEFLSELMLSRSALDRAAHLRTDLQFHDTAAANALVMTVCQGQVLVDPAGQCLILERARGDVHDTMFLGLDAAGLAYYAKRAEDLSSALMDGQFMSLREVGAHLSDRDAGMAVAAVALDHWMRSHERCPGCGSHLVTADGGWVQQCTACAKQVFPRTDPAIIVLVIDEHDRALLGRQAAWEPGWFSTLAGFVEAGESAEAAVRREVFEESGVVVGAHSGDITYLGSQPWPFPQSLMLGFHARAADPSITVDGSEIAEAAWFTREQLHQACLDGGVRLPPEISIARKLIEAWYGHELPGGWSRR